MWKSSIYNKYTFNDDGSLILYNSYMGALVLVSRENAISVLKALNEGIEGFPEGIMSELSLNGFFVPQRINEIKLADELYDIKFKNKEILHLILMPNENCNFRCKYCYEKHNKNKMSGDTINGIIKYVESKILNLSVLRVSWFGGEPLTAPEIIHELSSRLQEICACHSVDYTSSMTTNGYLLTTAMTEMLFKASIKRFQITLDGLQEEHDRLRVLSDGKTGTFQKIYKNLKELSNSNLLFRIVIRVNFTPNSINNIDNFLFFLGKEFGNDGRFSVDFHPVGNWGGNNDNQMNVYNFKEGRSVALKLNQKCSKQCFDLISLRNRMKPFGSACYASNPYSFVIGSDGKIYKCTVAFDDENNHIGYLTKDGELKLNNKKFMSFVSNNEKKQNKCITCFFRPACHGDACPMGNINHEQAVCPSIVINIDQTLRVLANSDKQ